MVDLVELKSGHVALQGPGRVLPAAQSDAMLDAEHLLADAAKHAAEMVESARNQAAAIRSAAREAGLEEATEEIQDRLFAIADASANALARTEERIVDMAVQIARRIIGSFDEAEIATRIAKKSLMLSARSSFIRLRVAPGAVEQLRERLDTILPTTMASASIEVIGDGRVHGGGCIMETDAGLIDATIDSQIAAIERGLQRSLSDTLVKEA